MQSEKKGFEFYNTLWSSCFPRNHQRIPTYFISLERAIQTIESFSRTIKIGWVLRKIWPVEKTYVFQSKKKWIWILQHSLTLLFSQQLSTQLHIVYIIAKGYSNHREIQSNHRNRLSIKKDMTGWIDLCFAFGKKRIWILQHSLIVLFPQKSSTHPNLVYIIGKGYSNHREIQLNHWNRLSIKKDMTGWMNLGIIYCKLVRLRDHDRIEFYNTLWPSYFSRNYQRNST